MKIERFEKSPAGRLVPITFDDPRTGKPVTHAAFVPVDLPSSIPLSQATYKLLSVADRALGALDANAGLLPNPRLLIQPSLTKEAWATSALEGTYAPLEDVFESAYVEEGRRSAEVREIMNYVAAAQQGLDLIASKPICVTLIAQLQEILANRTRGDRYDAGRLREHQVCIGNEGLDITASRFVPTPPGDELRDRISAWEKWINQEDEIPLLVKAAVGHYQFETIHPFSDGNGRLGRLIVTLQLVAAEALTFPILNLSPWLEPRREVYMDHLLEASETGDFDPWVAFFATAVTARADAASQAIRQLLNARNEFLETLRDERARGFILDLASDLIGYPVLDASTTASKYNVSYPTANAAIERLCSIGILREITGRSYGRIFRCDRVYEIIASA